MLWDDENLYVYTAVKDSSSGIVDFDKVTLDPLWPHIYTYQDTLEEVYRDVGITDRNTYNGEGIKVGILEIAHPDSTANFPASTINNYGNNRTSQHTTAVMSLIGGTYDQL